MRELAGLEFAEIGAALGTSAAVARQTLYDARLGLRQMDEGREMSCAAVTRALSDGDGRVSRRRDLRAHLRTCAECRRFDAEIEGRERDFAALAPLPALAAAGLLQGLFGGGAGGAGGAVAGGGVAAGVGGGTAQTIGAVTLLKGAAAVAVVAAIGVGAADRSGLVDVGGPGGDSAPAPVRSADESAETPGASGSESAARGGARKVEPGAARLRRVSDARAAGSAAPIAPGSGTGSTDASGPAPPVLQEGTGPNAHPHGREHEKQHPSASAHGQQTAATHKAEAGGRGSTTGGTSHPTHPPKPAHPPTPSTEKRSTAATPAPATTSPGQQAHGQAAAAAPEPGAVPSAKESGKKP